MSDLGTIICLIAIGFWWGEWAAERKARDSTSTDSPAFKLLFEMVQSVRAKRKFVGPTFSITREERFEMLGEKFTLSLRSEGDPNAAESEAV